jgi:hypothetical protein
MPRELDEAKVGPCSRKDSPRGSVFCPLEVPSTTLQDHDFTKNDDHPYPFTREEWGASTPFQYFTDHDDPELGRAVREGRRASSPVSAGHLRQSPTRKTQPRLRARNWIGESARAPCRPLRLASGLNSAAAHDSGPGRRADGPGARAR